VQALAEERSLMARIAAEPLRAQVALLFRYDDLWALEIQPQRQGFHYLRHLYLYYQALLKLGVVVNLVAETADLSPYNLVLAPTLHMPDRALVDRLTTYVRQGGTLLLGVRSGFKTPGNLVTDLPLPGLLRELAGVRVTTWGALPDGVEIGVETELPSLAGPATYWYETLQTGTAAVLANYEGGGAALTMNTLGSGHVYTLGWYANPIQAQSLAQYLCRKCGIEPQAAVPDGVLSFKRGEYILLLNFTDQAQVAEVNGRQVNIPARDIIVIA
jgi:beta-galactosidase